MHIHTAPLFRDLNVLTIHQLNLLHVALFMYKVYNNLLPQYFIDMFVPNCTVHSHNARQRDDFHMPYHRLVSTSNSIRVYGVNVWNSICKDIRNIKSLKYLLFSLFCIMYHVRCMSLFVTADLCILSLAFFEIRFATFECVFLTFYFYFSRCNKQLN